MLDSSVPLKFQWAQVDVKLRRHMQYRDELRENKTRLIGPEWLVRHWLGLVNFPTDWHRDWENKFAVEDIKKYMLELSPSLITAARKAEHDNISVKGSQDQCEMCDE